MKRTSAPVADHLSRRPWCSDHLHGCLFVFSPRRVLSLKGSRCFLEKFVGDSGAGSGWLILEAMMMVRFKMIGR